MRFNFDENDDLVLEDIPDDLMDLTTKIAQDRRISVDDVWREILTQWSKEYTA